MRELGGPQWLGMQFCIFLAPSPRAGIDRRQSSFRMANQSDFATGPNRQTGCGPNRMPLGGGTPLPHARVPPLGPGNGPATDFVTDSTHLACCAETGAEEIDAPCNHPSRPQPPRPKRPRVALRQGRRLGAGECQKVASRTGFEPVLPT